MRAIPALGVSLCILTSPLPVHAAEAWLPADSDRVELAAPALAGGQLDELRGGFQVPGGQTFAFGLERTVLVDGSTVAMQRLSIPDIGAAIAQGTQAKWIVTNPGGSAITSLANGALQSALTQAGTTILSSSQQPLLVVQNVVDNRLIQTLTTISVAVPSLSAYQNMRLMEGVRNATVLTRCGGERRWPDRGWTPPSTRPR